jgi:hypothetical protein
VTASPPAPSETSAAIAAVVTMATTSPISPSESSKILRARSSSERSELRASGKRLRGYREARETPRYIAAAAPRAIRTGSPFYWSR